MDFKKIFENKLALVITALVLVSIIGLFFSGLINQTSEEPNGNLILKKKINGVILLSENSGNIDGFYQWEKELDSKDFKAIVKPERFVLELYPDYFRKLSQKGHEIATGYGEAPFWGMPYEEQYEIMKEYKEYLESVTGIPLKIFSSKYFAYDENTLKAADELKIPYILGRGTGLEAAIYSPTEYNTKILFVSNMMFGEMGSGSLCDSSLFDRGANANEFAEILHETLSEDYEDLVLVSHVKIGGTRTDWWDVYKEGINSPKVDWKSFDKWEQEVKKISADYKDIPFNDEVKYMQPTPIVPLEELELVPALNARGKVIYFHNGLGEMCVDFTNFLETITYPTEEHLIEEENFRLLLAKYVNEYDKSEGYSTNFGYYPIIFINQRAFSGFNEETKEAILEEINKN